MINYLCKNGYSIEKKKDFSGASKLLYYLIMYVSVSVIAIECIPPDILFSFVQLNWFYSFYEEFNVIIYYIL